MGSGPSHEEKDGAQTPTTRHRGSTSGDPASMRRMHWVIYDAKGKHSIIAEHDVITGRRLLVADGQQIVYKKRVLLDRGDTFPFTVGSHHCVVMIRDIELKFLYGLIVDGLPVHEYHQKFFQNALYYTFPITVSPFSPTHQYTPSSSKSEDLSSPANEHVQNLSGIEEASSLESDTLSPQEAVAVADTLIASAVVSRRKSKADISTDTPEASVLAAPSTSSLPTTPNTRGASKSVVTSVPTVPPTSAIPATATYTIHNPNHHTCIVITHPSLAVLVDDEPVELHSQFAELTTELFNKDNHIHDGENLHIVHHDAQHEPNPSTTVDGTIHGFTCDSFLTVCELLTRPVNKNRPAVGTNSRSTSTSNTLIVPSSDPDRSRSLTIHTGNTDTIPLISTSPHTSPHDDIKQHRETSSLPNSMPSSPTAATTSATSTSTSTSSSNISSGFEYELRVNGFVQEPLPPPPVPYFNQAAILEQQVMEIPIARLRQEYEKWKESH